MTNKLFCEIKTSDINSAGFTVTYVFDAKSNENIGYTTFAVPDFANTNVELINLQQSEFLGEIPEDCINSSGAFLFSNAGDRNSVNIADILINKYYKSDKVYKINSITLRVHYKLPATAKFVNNFTRSFYADIINPEHLPYLINERTQKSGNQLQASSWFDRTKNYIKLLTYNQGVASCSVKSLIDIDPSWQGKPSSNLVMLLNGKQYPFYIKDADGFISNDDKIYFLGQIPHGDTTYFDFYEAKQAFFLYLSENETGLRLSLMQEAPATESEIKSVSVSRHIENPVNFSFNEDYIMDNQWNKAYYKKNLFPDSNNVMNKYNDFIFLQPSDNSVDKVNIRLNWQSEKDTLRYSDSLRRYSVKYSINNNLINTYNFVGRYFSKDITSYNNIELINGMNSISLLMSFIKKSYQGSVLVKSVDISGKEIPLGLSGIASYSIDNLSQNSKIEVPGFLAETIAIDSLNRTIAFPLTFKADFLSAGALAKQTNLLSTTINDKTYYKDDKGILISFYNQVKDSLISKFFTQDDVEILNLLDKAAGKPLAIACNMDKVLSNNILDKIRTITGADLSQASGIPWSLIYSANDYKLKVNSGIANVFGTFTNNSSKYFKASMNLSSGKSYKFFVNDERSLEQITPQYVNQSQLNFADQQSDVLILTHRNFLNAAKRLAEYRKKQTGLTIKVIDVDDIYNEFNEGRQSPYAIKDFLKFAYNSWRTPQPKYLVLFGDANVDHRKLVKGTIDNNWVPVYGMPYSDYWYTTLTNDNNQINLVVGRIPVNATKESELFVDKLMRYDEEPQSPWMKRFLFISGGLAENELHDFLDWTMQFTDFITPLPFGADTVIVKKTELGVTETDGSKVIEQINKGAAWTNFIGHGASDVFDLDGWNAEFLSNTNKYGVLTTLSCNTANFAIPNFQVSRNESYIIQPYSGHIATIGSSAGSFVAPASYLLQDMFTGIANPNPNYHLRRLGDILTYGKNKIKANAGNYYRITKTYIHLLGDPLTRLRIAEDIDLYLTKSDMEIHPEVTGKTILESDDFVKFKGKVNNAGYCTNKNVNVLITRQFESKIDSFHVEVSPLCKTIS